MEITAQQASILERLHALSFELVAFPMYENYIGVRKGNCAALLAPQGSGGLHIYGQPTCIVNGNLSARVIQADGHYFVAKKDRLKATAELNRELGEFSAQLAQTLLPTA